jgi:hypothetical protein
MYQSVPKFIEGADLESCARGICAHIDRLCVEPDSGSDSAAELCSSLRSIFSSISASDLTWAVSLLRKCLEVRAGNASIELPVIIEACEGIQRIGEIFAACSQSALQVDIKQECMSHIMSMMRSGVFSRVTSVKTLSAAGADLFERFLAAACRGMACLSEAISTLIICRTTSPESGLEGILKLLGCAGSWLQVLIAVGNEAVEASKEQSAPKEMRTGLILTKVWKEVAKLLQSVPVQYSDIVVDEANTAFSIAWQELMVRHHYQCGRWAAHGMLVYCKCTVCKWAQLLLRGHCLRRMQIRSNVTMSVSAGHLCQLATVTQISAWMRSPTMCHFRAHAVQR